MRHIVYAVRIVLQVVGLMLIVTSCVLRVRGQPIARSMFLAGIVLFMLAVLIHRVAQLKRCPQCAEKVNVETARCRQCGFDFPTSGVKSLSQPFYK
jgi:hypothetical protein